MYTEKALKDDDFKGLWNDDNLSNLLNKIKYLCEPLGHDQIWKNHHVLKG